MKTTKGLIDFLNWDLMVKFNTDEDLHTVLHYKRQLEASRGYKGVIAICIDRLCELHQRNSELIVEMWIGEMYAKSLSSGDCSVEIVTQRQA